jgi:hypothetical protein
VSSKRTNTQFPILFPPRHPGHGPDTCGASAAAAAAGSCRRPPADAARATSARCATGTANKKDDTAAREQGRTTEGTCESQTIQSKTVQYKAKQSRKAQAKPLSPAARHEVHEVGRLRAGNGQPPTVNRHSYGQRPNDHPAEGADGHRWLEGQAAPDPTCAALSTSSALACEGAAGQPPTVKDTPVKPCAACLPCPIPSTPHGQQQRYARALRKST